MREPCPCGTAEEPVVSVEASDDPSRIQFSITCPECGSFYTTFGEQWIKSLNCFRIMSLNKWK